jgi:hypothetical protein
VVVPFDETAPIPTAVHTHNDGEESLAPSDGTTAKQDTVDPLRCLAPQRLEPDESHGLLRRTGTSAFARLSMLEMFISQWGGR